MLESSITTHGDRAGNPAGARVTGTSGIRRGDAQVQSSESGQRGQPRCGVFAETPSPEKHPSSRQAMAHASRVQCRPQQSVHRGRLHERLNCRFSIRNPGANSNAVGREPPRGRHRMQPLPKCFCAAASSHRQTTRLQQLATSSTPSVRFPELCRTCVPARATPHGQTHAVSPTAATPGRTNRNACPATMHSQHCPDTRTRNRAQQKERPPGTEPARSLIAHKAWDRESGMRTARTVRG